MIYEEITFEKNFQVGDFLFEKAIIKGKLEPGETVAEALNGAKKEAIAWFMQSTGQYTVSSDNRPIPQQMGPAPLPDIPVEKPIPEDQRLAIMISDIMNCKTLEGNDGLLSYKNFVDRENKPDITAAYQMMLKKLFK